MIAPITRSSFFQDYYERAPLVVHRNDPAYYADILELEQVWQHIEAHCPANSEMSMIKLGAGVPEGGFTSNGRADPIRIAELYNDGWTIGLNRMQQHLPALAALCAAGESVLSHPFQTNLYLTPPGAQGFMPHWDTHDVFVLQVHGSKEWTIYDTKIELPIPAQSFDLEKPEAGPATTTFTLRAGDLLYCPRGLMHSAKSSEDTSLHITFGLMGRTWSELLVDILSELALREPALRRNLPAGFARTDFDVQQATTGFAEVMDILRDKADLAAVLAQSRDSFIASRVRRLPGQARQLEQLDALAETSQACARPSLMVALDQDDEAITVTCGLSVLTLPEFTAAALRAALSGDTFTVGDLPGPLDAPGKLTLVRRLIREGLVEQID